MNVRRFIAIAVLGLAIAAGSACRPVSNDVMPGPVCTVTIVDGHAQDFCQ